MDSLDRLPKCVRREVVLREENRPVHRVLIDLPLELLHTIMLHVAQDLKDYYCAIAASTTLRRVATDKTFLREVDLYTIQIPWIWDRDARKDFFIRCHHTGNISALFMQGCSQFFHNQDLENGLAMIREAALSGYELAIYFYSNLMRLLNPTLEIDLDLVSPSRDLVIRMRRRVENFDHHFWQPDPMPQLYLERCDAFNSSIIRLCHCAWNDRWRQDWDEDVKDPWMCDLWFYTIHVLGFIREIPNKLYKWPMEYYF